MRAPWLPGCTAPLRPDLKAPRRAGKQGRARGGWEQGCAPRTFSRPQTPPQAQRLACRALPGHGKQWSTAAMKTPKRRTEQRAQRQSCQEIERRVQRHPGARGKHPELLGKAAPTSRTRTGEQQGKNWESRQPLLCSLTIFMLFLLVRRRFRHTLC